MEGGQAHLRCSAGWGLIHWHMQFIVYDCFMLSKVKIVQSLFSSVFCTNFVENVAHTLNLVGVR